MEIPDCGGMLSQIGEGPNLAIPRCGLLCLRYWPGRSSAAELKLYSLLNWAEVVAASPCATGSFSNLGSWCVFFLFLNLEIREPISSYPAPALNF